MTPDSPINVVFVCTANICRSAYAEMRARQVLGNRSTVQVGSAGVHGWIDQPMDPPMAQELSARGGNASTFASRRLTADIVRDADLLLTAEAAHRQFILEEWPAAFRRVFTLRQFADAVGTASETVQGRDLIAHAAALRRPAHPSDNVRDPFGRGPAAAAACAVELDALLAAILPRLAARASA